jgi:hypothetical protein
LHRFLAAVKSSLNGTWFTFAGMENFEARWIAVESLLEARFEKVPDMEGILFLIGINEFGLPPKRAKFTKEQKQDLMHVAVCSLLSQEGYYELQGYDDEGWPHFVPLKEVEVADMAGQEQLLKECVIRYFGC